MSGTVQIESFNAEFLTREELHDLIFYRKSFDITNVTDISETVKRVEYAIKHQHKKLTCRVKHCGGRLPMVTNSTAGSSERCRNRCP